VTTGEQSDPSLALPKPLPSPLLQGEGSGIYSLEELSGSPFRAKKAKHPLSSPLAGGNEGGWEGGWGVRFSNFANNIIYLLASKLAMFCLNPCYSK